MRSAEAFPEAWADGRAMPPEQAIEYALALPEIPTSAPSPVLPPPPAYPADLTAREVEVLRLLAHGLTYAQIAEKLFVTRRTVNGHVTSIYSKLGVNGRVAATRLAVEYRLV
jgi:DNA-binding NarL/FixJ family response regulator